MKKIFIALCMLFAITFGLSAKQYVKSGSVGNYNFDVWNELKELIEKGFHIDQVLLFDKNGTTSNYIIVYSDNE